VSVADDFKLAVLRATDIVQLVGEHLPLARAGKSWKALCPFHPDKNPSLHVWTDRQVWKCFGCQARGNAIDFLMKKEGLEFRAALLALADRAGLKPPDPGRGGGAPGAGGGRLEALEANKVATEFFKRALRETQEAEVARRYVESRGIDEETADRFDLGYAPDRWDGLLRYGSRRRLDGAALERAGLAHARKTGTGRYDRFRGRLMFPIRDSLGRVVGFGARLIGKEEGADHGPKYLNSPETAAFKKGELLYGLDVAKEAIRERGEVAVVEGYTDVILAHQAGFPWVVATLGTAFGAAHARVLRSYARRLVLVYDADPAGEKANRRGLSEAARAGLGLFEEMRVAYLDAGLDPADVIVKQGPGAFRAALAAARDVVDVLVEPAKRASTLERAQALDEVLLVLSSLRSEGVETYRELEIARLAEELRIPQPTLRARAERLRAEVGRREREDAARASARAATSAAKGTGGAPPPAPAVEAPPLAGLDRRALAVLLARPALVEAARAKLRLEWLEDARARAAVGAILAGGRADSTPAELVALGEDEATRRAASEVAAALEDEIDYAAEWPSLVARLEERSLRRRYDELPEDERLLKTQEINRRLKAAKRPQAGNVGGLSSTVSSGRREVKPEAGHAGA